MLLFYEVENYLVKQVMVPGEGCWVDAPRPGKGELDQLKTNFGIPRDFLRYSLDPYERPRYENAEECTLFVLQASHTLEPGSNIPYDTVPLAIVLTSHHVVTICGHARTVLMDMKNNRYRLGDLQNRNRFVLEVMLRIAQRYLSDLRAIERKLEDLEQTLERTTRNRELIVLMKLQKSLVYFKTALKSNNLLLERMRHDKKLHLDAESRAMLEDVLIESQQALEMTDIYLSILGNTMALFGSVISNNVNTVVRLLTITTMLLAIPTLVAGFFGMNVPIPGEASPNMFLRIIGTCLGVIGGLLWYFRKQNWI